MNSSPLGKLEMARAHSWSMDCWAVRRQRHRPKALMRTLGRLCWCIQVMAGRISSDASSLVELDWIYCWQEAANLRSCRT